jgi:glycerol-3-phosphate acyltransferase PlsX
VGTEDLKGNDIVKKAAEELNILKNKSLINFYGFVEGSDISIGKTNVVVTDGFTGNIALKTAEGTARMVQTYFERAFSSSLLSKLGYFLSSLALFSVKQRLDPRVHNCGIFAGLNAPVVKCHGDSDQLGVSYAVDIVFSLVKNNVNNQVRRILDETYNR